MSDIKAKIKKLEQLQTKVDYLREVIDITKKLKAATEDEKVVLPEVQELVEKVLIPVIESLEAGSDEFVGTMGVLNEKTPFDEEEIGFIKKLLAKAKNREPLTPSNPKESSQEPRKERKKVSGWVLENQHLGGKTVKTLVLSQEVTGEVIKLNEPYVVIKLESGKIHQATLDKIRVVNA